MEILLVVTSTPSELDSSDGLSRAKLRHLAEPVKFDFFDAEIVVLKLSGTMALARNRQMTHRSLGLSI